MRLQLYCSLLTLKSSHTLFSMTLRSYRHFNATLVASLVVLRRSCIFKICNLATLRSFHLVQLYWRFFEWRHSYKLRVLADCIGIFVVYLASTSLSSLVFLLLNYPSHFLLNSFLLDQLTGPLFLCASLGSHIQLKCWSSFSASVL